MNTTSRLITGILTILFGLFFIIFIGFVDGPGFDFWGVLFGIPILIVGFFILFNKREDDIEQREDK